MKGFKFGGGHSSSYNIKVTKVTHQSLPDIKLKTIDAPNMEGVYDAGVVLGSRKVEVDFILLSTTDEGRRTEVRKLVSWLFKEELQSLEFDDETGKIYKARLENSFDVEEVHTYGEGSLTFFIPKPFAESSTKTSHSMTGGTSISINNDGTFKSYPTITLTITSTTSLSQVEIDRDLNGDTTKRQKVILNGTFATNDKIVIDCEKGKITHNGANAITKMTLTSDFFPFEVGSQTIHLTTGVSATIDYFKRHL